MGFGLTKSHFVNRFGFIFLRKLKLVLAVAFLLSGYSVAQSPGPKPPGVAPGAYHLVQPIKKISVTRVEALSALPEPTPSITPEAVSQAVSDTSMPGCGAFSGAMEYIFCHESTDNPGAINPSSGACGLGQAWPCSKMPCTLTDVNCQVSYFSQYANERYGGWGGAMNYWEAHSNW